MSKRSLNSAANKAANVASSGLGNADPKPTGVSWTTHGVMMLTTGLVLLLVWRTTNGHAIITAAGGIILLLLALKNYPTIVKQLEGI